MSNAEADWDRLLSAPVLPLFAPSDVASAVGCARALHAAGVPAIEVTLRTAAAWDGIRAILAEVPGLAVGVGTVVSTEQMQDCVRQGAHFAISPGATPRLLAAGRDLGLPYLPAITTASELLAGLEFDYRSFKFFPAEHAGGPGTLKALGGPFADCRFVATGGVSPDNARSYLALSNVRAVGASWITPAARIQAGDWAGISALARAALALRTPA